ncbi:MAG: sel1 repeat family protein [Magnetococcales bacterium]|nr:sel1 repeat family protein [Magnetococcales bacterium]
MKKVNTLKPEMIDSVLEQPTAVGFHNVDQGDYVATLATFASWGDPKAQHNLGALYLEGVEVKQDYAEALKWHTLAAEQDYVLAQHDLGTMYLEGLGIAPDLVAAYYWFTKAAERGDAKAQSNLGILYATGEGVAEDVVEAAKWFRLSAAAGLLDGLENLQIAHEEMTPQQRAESEKRAADWSPIKA